MKTSSESQRHKTSIMLFVLSLNCAENLYTCLCLLGEFVYVTENIISSLETVEKAWRLFETVWCLPNTILRIGVH